MNVDVDENVDDDDVTVDVDTAIPCGRIIHEPVSIALKHAFGDEGGDILES